MSISPLQRCSSTNRFGEPCAAKPVTKDEDGRPLCAVHGGLSDPQAMGRAGGSSAETALRKQVRGDDHLRESARKVLADALAGKAVDKQQLDAARSLFAYRAAEAPRGEREQAQGGVQLPDGRAVVSLADVLQLCLELPVGGSTAGSDVLADARLQNVILACAEHVRELQAAGVRESGDDDDDYPEAA